MFIFDRIYGRLSFPAIINDIIYCPGLMRLREVRMANIPFFSFPSFSAITRYEHSLGVCHLAGLFADKVGLPEKETLELMFASLYHDVATPPFAHAMEEVLNELFGFDHEQKLREIIIGKSRDLGGQRLQLFLGHSLKIHKICQSSFGRKLGLDIYKIADIAAGSHNDPLGGVVCSSDIDLDNIDNVVRASLSMGIGGIDPQLPEILAKSFVLTQNTVSINEAALDYIKIWQNLRSILYGMIFASLRDFSLQTMLKDAVRCLLNADYNYRLRENDWSLTDEQLIYERLLKYQPSREIVNRMRLGKFYECLAFIILEGRDLLENQPLLIEKIRKIAADVFSDFLKTSLNPIKRELNPPKVLVNVYVDKRIRKIKKQLIFFDDKKNFDDDISSPKLIVGVFTPYHRIWDKKAFRAFVDISTDQLPGVCIKLAKITSGKFPDVIGVDPY